MNSAYNLDDDREYFTFTIFGYTYNFKYLTSDEMEELSTQSDEQRGMDTLTKYITPMDGAPQFTEIMGRMRTPQLKNFMKMVSTELGMKNEATS